MAKVLDQFTVRVNKDCWYIRGFATIAQGRMFQGSQIHPRMIQAVEDHETFLDASGNEVNVCNLIGGTVEELKEAIADSKGKKRKPKPKAATKKVVAPPPPPKPEPEPEEEEPEEEELEEEEPDAPEFEDEEDEDDEDEEDDEG